MSLRVFSDANLSTQAKIHLFKERRVSNLGRAEYREINAAKSKNIII
jgi:hypothetical protein